MLSPLLDTLPFTLGLPGAAELRDLFTNAYWRVSSARDIAIRAGINFGVVNAEQPLSIVWYEILRAARDQGRLRTLVEAALADSTIQAYHSRIHELIADVPVVEAQGSDGSPFSEGDEERQIEARRTLLNIAFLARGLEFAPAIVRLTVTCASGKYHGTGSLIAEDLILTNHHVLYDWNSNASPASAVEIRFEYEVDFDGKEREHRSYPGEVATIKGDRGHDFAVVRIAKPLEKSYPILPLAPSAPPAVDDRVYIIQHPGGEPKQIGLHHNDVRQVDSNIVHYRTDTYHGSSGSPVFNERWEVVALHRGWVESGRINGQRIYRNRGTRIERVVEGLKKLGVSFGAPQ